MPATTIKQIAKELGIHPSTVSRALSGHPHIAEKTREKVLRMADQLNYMPNLWAQNLVGSKTNLIGCLVLELTNPFYIPMLRAIQDKADQQSYITFIGESRRNLEIEKQVIERFRRIRASGVIITPVLSNLDHLKNLEEDGVPVIAVGRTVKELDFVDEDNIKSGMIAGQHFIDRGFEEIGYIQSGNEYNFPEKDRLTGFEKVISEHGRNLCAVYTVGNNRIEGGEKAGKMWFSEKERPEAVFCSNDILAMGFIQYLVRLGVQIPDDVAVLGHDDVSFADRFIVPLSTVASPIYEMGQHAINLLLDRISNHEYSHEPQMISLKPELVLRKSCI